MSQYRDGLAGLVAQVEAKRLVARDRQARLGPVLRSMLPPELVEEIDSLEATLAQSRADLAGLTEADAALDALAIAYDDAFELAPSLAQCADSPPEVAAPSTPAPWLIEEHRTLQFRAALEQEAATAFGKLEIARWGDFGYVGRTTETEIPILLVAALSSVHRPHDASWPRWVLSLHTTMPPALPGLRVQRKQALLSLGAALGVTERVRLDDPTFDEELWIRGSAATATLLGSAARSALLALAAYDVDLTVSRGVAAVEWRGELDPWAPHLYVEPARDVLVGLRRELAILAT